MTSPILRIVHGDQMSATFTSVALASRVALALVPVLGYMPTVEVLRNGKWIDAAWMVDA